MTFPSHIRPAALFDRSFLSPARFEFVVVTDTHYMLPTPPGPIEFESRRLQSRRMTVALRMAAALRPAFIMHLGDMVQESPDSPKITRALNEAGRPIRQCGIKVHHVAGNQDIGDKPDPTMPTRSVDFKSLGRFHARFGPSWYGFSHGGCRFIVLNSQILNTGLVVEKRQRLWFEKELARNRGKRMFLFLHLPPYIFEPREPGLGHYDNIDEPARGWLLGLVRRYHVGMMFSGHTHFAFYDRLNSTRFHVLASPAFTRPGFCTFFASAPPPERGRNDTPKLGFYLFRVHDHHTDIHFIRTGGALSMPESKGGRLLLSPPSFPGRHSPLGVTLFHPLTRWGEIPMAWPATIRETARNDYPALLLQELGAGRIRTPCADLHDPMQGRRLDILRRDGIKITALCLGMDALEQSSRDHRNQVDTWELQIPGRILPAAAELRRLQKLQQSKNLQLSLCPVIPHELKDGKQLPRTRIGYHPAELKALAALLKSWNMRVDRISCRIPTNKTAWEIWSASWIRSASHHVGCIDWLVELPVAGDLENMNRAAEALFLSPLLHGGCLCFEPLMELDRTMDASHGLLDSLCNPRPAFHVLRSLNTLLSPLLRKPFVGGGSAMELKSASTRMLGRENTLWTLLLPRHLSVGLSHSLVEFFKKFPSTKSVVYDLLRGISWGGTTRKLLKDLETAHSASPLLICSEQPGRESF